MYLRYFKSGTSPCLEKGKRLLKALLLKIMLVPVVGIARGGKASRHSFGLSFGEIQGHTEFSGFVLIKLSRCIQPDAYISTAHLVCSTSRGWF